MQTPQRHRADIERDAEQVLRDFRRGRISARVRDGILADLDRELDAKTEPREWVFDVPEEGRIVRQSEQIARYDHDVRLEPGTYALRPTLIDGRDVPEHGTPYYYVANVPARHVRDGIGFGGGRQSKAGEATVYHLMLYPFQLGLHGTRQA